jgi:hypothetical protein
MILPGSVSAYQKDGKHVRGACRDQHCPSSENTKQLFFLIHHI